MPELKEIMICDHHEDYPVPYIGTMAFPGAEAWCPYCGASTGVFGPGTKVKETPTLKNRLEAYRKFSRQFLRARSRRVCYSTVIRGKTYLRVDIPECTVKRDQKVLDAWEYKVKVK